MLELVQVSFSRIPEQLETHGRPTEEVLAKIEETACLRARL
jgi:hypothetical protein